MPRTPRGAETRARLLQVGAELFARQGYEATSLKDLLAGAGIAKGAFYQHFESKEVFVRSVLSEVQAQMTALLDEAASQHSRPLDQLRAIWLTRIQLGATIEARCMRRLTSELARHPTLNVIVAELSWKPVDDTARLLSRAQEEGVLHPEMSPEKVAPVIVGSIFGLETLHEVQPQFRAGELAEDFLNGYLAGLRH